MWITATSICKCFKIHPTPSSQSVQQDVVRVELNCLLPECITTACISSTAQEGTVQLTTYWINLGEETVFPRRTQLKLVIVFNSSLKTVVTV